MADSNVSACVIACDGTPTPTPTITPTPTPGPTSTPGPNPTSSPTPTPTPTTTVTPTLTPSPSPSPSLSLTPTPTIKQPPAPSIGLTVFGYTNPNSKVELTATSAYSQTFSDQTGFFSFSQVVLPNATKEYCITSTDQFSRSTPPVCLLSPLSLDSSTSIGPIILPPTLSVEKLASKPTTLLVATGQTVPKTTVSISLFQVEDHPRLVKTAQAFSLPTFTATANSSGTFSLTLPTNYQSQYRFFATTSFQNQPSPKSFTLNYSLPPSPNLTPLIVVFFFTLLLFVYLLIKRSKKSSFFPALYPKSLTLYN